MAPTEDAVKCPKCGSGQIHAEKRGWRLTTGFIGSGKIRMTCLKCGNKFWPGGGMPHPRTQEEQHYDSIGFLVLIGLILIDYMLLRSC
jgi:hypothetical protein